MTPQQPVKQGANTDKVTFNTLDDNFKNEIICLCTVKYKGFFV